MPRQVLDERQDYSAQAGRQEGHDSIFWRRNYQPNRHARLGTSTHFATTAAGIKPSQQKQVLFYLKVALNPHAYLYRIIRRYGTCIERNIRLRGTETLV